MPLEDGYATEKRNDKVLEFMSYEIAKAITGYLTEDLDKEVLGNIIPKFALFLIDLNTGKAKYITDLKDKPATIKMLLDAAHSKMKDLDGTEMEKFHKLMNPESPKENSENVTQKETITNADVGEVSAEELIGDTNKKETIN